MSIEERLEELRTLILETQKLHYTVEEAAEYLDLEVNYLYKLNHLRVIPHFKPTHGRKVYYLKQDLDNYVRGKRIEN